MYFKLMNMFYNLKMIANIFVACGMFYLTQYLYQTDFTDTMGILLGVFIIAAIANYFIPGRHLYTCIIGIFILEIIASMAMSGVLN